MQLSSIESRVIRRRNATRLMTRPARQSSQPVRQQRARNPRRICILSSRTAYICATACVLRQTVSRALRENDVCAHFKQLDGTRMHIAAILLIIPICVSNMCVTIINACMRIARSRRNTSVCFLRRHIYTKHIIVVCAIVVLNIIAFGFQPFAERDSHALHSTRRGDDNWV